MNAQLSICLRSRRRSREQQYQSHQQPHSHSHPSSPHPRNPPLCRSDRTMGDGPSSLECFTLHPLARASTSTPHSPLTPYQPTTPLVAVRAHAKRQYHYHHHHHHQGRSQDWVSGGAPISGGPTPYFSPQTPNHKGPPLCTFGYPGFRGGAPPGYALDHHCHTSRYEVVAAKVFCREV